MPLLHRPAGLLACIAFLAGLVLFPVEQSFAQTPERRFALVIGNSEYQAGRLPTAANDAGLIGETLRTAGFDVAGARDLDLDTLRQSIGEFLDKVSAAGPETVSFVYLAGYGVQYEGENYFVPIDATLRRVEDIPIEAFRISDFIQALAATPGRKLFVIDAARQHPFAPAGPPLASGLALVGPQPKMLIALNATPGSIAIIENGSYGAFAQATAEMIGTGGLALDDLFARIRLRVYETTNGVAVPWYTSTIDSPFLFMERTRPAGWPKTMSMADLQRRKIGAFGGDQDAFAAALAIDSLTAYEEFLAVYRDSPLAPRVRAIIAVRREATIWRDTLNVDTREAYWSYLQRYPLGAHLADAQRRLAALAAGLEPPPAFAPMAHGVGIPPADEVIFVSQPVLVFTGPGFVSSPPIPSFLLQPLTPEFSILAPHPPLAAFFLPVPVVPYGSWARPPAFVRLPTQSPIQQFTSNNTAFEQSTGGATPPSIALPAAVVTRVNAGILRPPPPAAPAPAPINLSAATAAAARMPAQSPALPQPNGLRAASPATAAITPAPTPMAPLLPLPHLGVAGPGRPATSTTTLPTTNRPRGPALATTSLLPPSRNHTGPAAPPPPQLTAIPPPPRAASSPQNISRLAPPPPQVEPPPAPTQNGPSPQNLARPATAPPPPPQIANRPSPPPPVSRLGPASQSTLQPTANGPVAPPTARTPRQSSKLN